MKGFTVLPTEMFERDDEEKREVGKWHTIDGYLYAPNAWHYFHANFEDAIPDLGCVNKPRLFTCETGEKIITEDDYYIARDIRLIREIDTQTIKAYLTANFDTLFNSDNAYVRAALAKYGIGLEELVDDPSYHVRCEVVANGYALDKLIDDDNCEVRAAVVRQGYRLDKLIKDPDFSVRAEVAMAGYGLEELVKDPDEAVRATVAEMGKFLDVLIDDPDPDVRVAVANQGYGFEKLVNDPDESVRAIVAGFGYGHDILANDPSSEVRNAIQYWKCVNTIEKSEEIFNKYCDELTEEQKELARKCTAPLLDKSIELYECGLQSFVSTLKG